MESTPLVLAHAHARNASNETLKANPTAASEEHDLAAGEFANAAKSTGDAEALRTLTLLEQHHQKLAELLKFRPQDTHPTPSTSTPAPQPPSASASAPLPPKTLESSPRHISQHLSPHRDLTSSIASNLASARGIPSNRQRRGNQVPTSLSTQLAEGRAVTSLRRRSSKLNESETSTPTNPDEAVPKSARPFALSPSRARVSSPDITTTSPIRQTPTNAPPAEDSFSRFYAAFSPFLAKLSAPLAFAGLPLNPDPPPVPPPSEKSPSNAKAVPPLDPDLTRLFSRAALRAVEHGNPAESFYVVPTTGGTMSYAGMLANTKHGSHLTASDEEFVDARETMQPTSPGLARRGRAPSVRIGSGKTMEELQVENETLKAVAIDLGDRLRAFEMGAQRSSMALHMSMRAMQSPSASTANAREQGKLGGEKSASEQEIRIKELEDEVRDVRKEMKKLARENQKLVGVVERYRERWEILKDGARERMKGDGRDGEGRN
ncbi:hypothetical protein MMC13_002709 [Lambiella insularis]|nr:hypothetical protein [Lambiella insularis]